MGMFDDIRCQYPLPLAGASERLFQTKDLYCDLDYYEIREDGTLWREEYDTRIEETDAAPLGYWIHHENKRFVQDKFTGELEIHDCDDQPGGKWYSFKLTFVDGVVKDVVDCCR